MKNKAIKKIIIPVLLAFVITVAGCGSEHEEQFGSDTIINPVINEHIQLKLDGVDIRFDSGINPCDRILAGINLYNTSDFDLHNARIWVNLFDHNGNYITTGQSQHVNMKHIRPRTSEIFTMTFYFFDGFDFSNYDLMGEFQYDYRIAFDIKEEVIRTSGRGLRRRSRTVTLTTPHMKDFAAPLDIPGLDEMDFDETAAPVETADTTTEENEDELKNPPASGVTVDIDGVTVDTNVIIAKLSNKGINDISGIETLKDLVTLQLNANNISDFTPLYELPKLQHLFVGENALTDIDFVSGLPNLKELVLHSMFGGADRRNSINDISPIRSLQNLERLHLGSNPVNDLRPLHEVRSLRSLAFNSNPHINISQLRGMYWLTRLDLPLCSLEDINSLSDLSGLTYLSLQGNNITDISPLSGLAGLETLYLMNNGGITDITPLSGLNSIRTLWLQNNEIQDISALSGLTNLENLDLSGNSIGDIRPLLGLSNLQSLRLREIPLTLEDKIALRTHIPNCVIYFE
jgi:Leucine-rich repeat (LRR) protein